MVEIPRVSFSGNDPDVVLPQLFSLIEVLTPDATPDDLIPILELFSSFHASPSLNISPHFISPLIPVIASLVPLVAIRVPSLQILDCVCSLSMPACVDFGVPVILCTLIPEADADALSVIFQIFHRIVREKVDAVITPLFVDSVMPFCVTPNPHMDLIGAIFIAPLSIEGFDDSDILQSCVEPLFNLVLIGDSETLVGWLGALAILLKSDIIDPGQKLFIEMNFHIRLLDLLAHPLPPVVEQALEVLSAFLAGGDEAVDFFLRNDILTATKALVHSSEPTILRALLRLYEMGHYAAESLIDPFVASLTDVDFVAFCDVTHPFDIRKNVAKLVLNYATLTTTNFTRALLPPEMIDVIIELIEAADETAQRDMAGRMQQVLQKAAVDSEFCEMLFERWSQSVVCLALFDAFDCE
jgi:hypothetical protein